MLGFDSVDSISGFGSDGTLVFLRADVTGFEQQADRALAERVSSVSNVFDP
ncbi:hypothetical protein [Natrialba swarupiae]|uniref:hypothetical protein n=1 Tax=Natrialba swarupiae TaxID=2448032 RepID=UPI001EE47B76|nr:hypothetical protein [Natrialba swarupiae]